MYIIKQIDDKDLYTLLELNKEMRAVISPEGSNLGCASQLIRELTYKDSLSVGLYHQNILIGFVSGYGLTKDVFFFSGIYIRKGHTLQLLGLLEKSESLIPKTYEVWESEGSSKAGINMLEKFKALKHRTIYRKEI